MKIKLRKSTEIEKDIIGLMQGYLGVIYITGAFIFQSWTWGLIL